MMALRRSVTAHAKTLCQQHRVAVPFSHIDRDDRENLPISEGSGISLGAGGFCGSRNMIQDRRFTISTAFAPVFVRTLGGGPGPEKAEIVIDVAAQAAPVANEVAVAAADSFPPVAALQYVIEWLSIVLTSILISSTIQIPLEIHRIKVVSKLVPIINPQLYEILDEDMSPAAVANREAQIEKLFNQYRVILSPYVKGILISLPFFRCFTLAIKNMAENVQSFKDGGALWFTDLSAPDSLMVFTVLVSLTFWMTIELDPLGDKILGRSSTRRFKNACGVISTLSIPVTACLPTAPLCFWITWNTCLAAYGLLLNTPEARKMLGLPELPSSPPPSANHE